MTPTQIFAFLVMPAVVVVLAGAAVLALKYFGADQPKSPPKL